MKTKLEDIRRTDVVFAEKNSDGGPIPGTEQYISILYNRNIITEEEVAELIHSGAYEYDERIIVTSTTQADHLRGLTKTVPTEKAHLKRISVLTCTHETKHGVDTFVSLHPSRDAALANIKAVQDSCDYNPENPERNEYFDYDVEEQVIDVNLLEDYISN